MDIVGICKKYDESVRSKVVNGFIVLLWILRSHVYGHVMVMLWSF